MVINSVSSCNKKPLKLRSKIYWLKINNASSHKKFNMADLNVTIKIKLYKITKTGFSYSKTSFFFCIFYRQYLGKLSQIHFSVKIWKQKVNTYCIFVTSTTTESEMWCGLGEKYIPSQSTVNPWFNRLKKKKNST